MKVEMVEVVCEIPAWLDTIAEEEGLGLSKILEEALIEKLNLTAEDIAKHRK